MPIRRCRERLKKARAWGVSMGATGGARAALCALAGGSAMAQGVVRIGVMNDMSGVYSDDQGPGSLLAAQMAVEDYGGLAGGLAAGQAGGVCGGDHQNKTDIGAQVARRWLDAEGVGMIIDLPNSGIALAINELVRDRNKVMIGSGAGTALLTGEKCSPNTVHWTYDTWAYGHGLARAVIQQGVRSVFFITADYPCGHHLEKQFSDEALKSGAKVLVSARHPLGTSDFASLLLQAQSSGADAVAFANAGGDTSNSLKQAGEFGLTPRQKLLALIMGQNNVRALGLQAAQGTMLVVPFYWDMSVTTRAWAQRFAQRHAKRNMPHELPGAPAGEPGAAARKAMPPDDPLFGQGVIRPDGRKIHPMYLFKVKAPAESKGPWDYYKLLATIPAEQAFRPLKDGGCSLVTN